MYAAYQGHADFVKVLIHHDLSSQQMTAIYKNGDSALMLAAQKGNAAVVKLLIDHRSSRAQLMAKDLAGIP